MGKVRFSEQRRFVWSHCFISVLHTEPTICSHLMMHSDNGGPGLKGVPLVFLSEVGVPSVIILNTSNEQYFLPGEPIQTMEQLVQFINGVLNGSAQVQTFLLPLICVYVFSLVPPPPPRIVPL